MCPVCKRKVFAQDERMSDSDSDTDADDTTPLVRAGPQGTQGGTFDRPSVGPIRQLRHCLLHCGVQSMEYSWQFFVCVHRVMLF